MKTYLSVLLGVSLSVFSVPAFAEEVPEEPVDTPAVEEVYTPPAEASDGPGGWAVVDPETGKVHGVTVCTIDVCGPNGAWGGKMPIEYQGCGTNCVLRFQSNAEKDGNVVGASEGVTWNGDRQKTFTMKHTDENGVIHTRTLVPEKTNKDERGFGSGIIEVRAEGSIGNNERKVVVRTSATDLGGQDRSISFLYLEKNVAPRLFDYLDVQSGVNNFKNDADAFADEVYPANEIPVPAEEGSEDGGFVSVPNELAEAVKAFTNTVMEFLRQAFGLEPMIDETVDEG